MAKLELTSLLDGLETALDAAPLAPALGPFQDSVAANWLEGEGDAVDLELARRRCRPRDAALARHLVPDATDRAALGDWDRFILHTTR